VVPFFGKEKIADINREKVQRFLAEQFSFSHAKVIVAADFLVAITAGFRALYVFVVMEVGSRRILQWNVTAHPTAAWTLQQFREAIPSDQTYRFMIHDRDSIFSAERACASLESLYLSWLWRSGARRERKFSVVVSDATSLSAFPPRGSLAWSALK
jgi:hypothetical protein